MDNNSASSLLLIRIGRGIFFTSEYMTSCCSLYGTFFKPSGNLENTCSLDIVLCIPRHFLVLRSRYLLVGNGSSYIPIPDIENIYVH
ncbi:unnamed protein product [Gordionus sp. m RMFG-2023]